MRLLLIAVVVAILLMGGLAGYAYFGDMKADPQETRLPVALDLGAAPAAVAPIAPAAPQSQPALPATATGAGADDLD